MIRLATIDDARKIADTYDELLQYEKINGSTSNWIPDVYPTIDVPLSKIPQSSMYVLEDNGEICASMVLNNIQAPEYEHIAWKFDAKKALVIHTLCIPPSKSKKGYGGKMVEFAKNFAEKTGCDAIRIDTYSHNEPAKALYQKHGFTISGYYDSVLEGLIHEELVFLEFKL